MKTQLTAEQSANLISKGVSAKRAARFPLCRDGKSGGWSEPIFTLNNLLEILQKGFNNYKDYTLSITADNNVWEVGYIDFSIYDTDNNLIAFTRTELIDALYELALYCIANKYLNKE